MDRPVIVRYDDGREYEVASAEVAWDAHPEATIVAYAPFGPYDGPRERPKPAKAAKAPEKPVEKAPEKPAEG